MDTGTIAALIAPVLALVVGWLGGKKSEQAKIKKVEAEADSIITVAAEKAVQLWQKLNDQLSGEVTELRGQVIALRNENSSLHEENKQLKVLVGDLRREVEQLKRKLN